MLEFNYMILNSVLHEVRKKNMIKNHNGKHGFMKEKKIHFEGRKEHAEKKNEKMS